MTGGGIEVVEPRPGSPPASPGTEDARAAAIDSSRFIVAVHVASLAVGFGVLLVAGRKQWFKQDDWSYIVFRSLPSDLVSALFDPYNGHWSTAPILQFRGLMSVIGLESYWPYLVPTLVLQVGVAHVLWRLMRQIGISSWIATSLAATFLVNGGTATVLFAPLQSGFVGALLLGLIVVLLANHEAIDRRRDVVAAVVAILSLTFSGVAIPIVAAGVIVAFLRRGWKGAAWLGVPSAAAYLLWFVIWGHKDFGNDSFEFGDFAQVPEFVWSGLRTTVELGTPLRALSALLVIALSVWLALQWRRARTDAAPAFAMAIAAVLLYIVISSQRIALFEDTGSVPDRYAYISWALLLPALGLALHVIGRRTPVRRVIAVIVGVVLLINAMVGLRGEYDRQTARARSVRATMLGAAAFVQREPFLPHVIVDHHSADGVAPLHLLELERRGDLPALPALTPGERRKAAIRIQARFNRKSTAPGLDDEIAAKARSVRGATTSPSGSCLRVEPGDAHPELALTVERQATIRVQSSRRGELGVRLDDVAGGDGGDAVSKPQPLRPGRPLFVQFAAGTRPVLLLPPAGPTQVCRLDLSE